LREELDQAAGLPGARQQALELFGWQYDNRLFALPCDPLWPFRMRPPKQFTPPRLGRMEFPGVSTRAAARLGSGRLLGTGPCHPVIS
jgi:hypothetical protein